MSEAYELSDLAREVLRSELERRGLSVEFAEQAPVPVKKAPELHLVRADALARLGDTGALTAYRLAVLKA